MDNANQGKVPTLRSLSLPVVTYGVVHNFYPEGHCQLVPFLGNDVFKMIHHPNLTLDTEKTMDKVLEPVKFNRAVLGRNNTNYYYRQLIYAQTIEKLELIDLLSSYMRLEAKPRDGMKRKGRPVRITIVSGLKRLLNLESRKAMQMLAIRGHGTVFPPGWMKDLTLLLPAMKSLDLSGCYVTNNDFATLMESNLHLEKLSLSQTGVTSIKGVGAQKRLRILCLEDLQIRSYEHISEVMELQNLEVLDISSNEGEQVTAKAFSFCEGSLPKLKFLDLSGNDLTVEMLRNIIGTHSNIAKISVIKTDFDRTTLFDDFKEGVEFYTIADLGACASSLMFYKSNVDRSKTILDRILSFVTIEMMGQLPHDLRKAALSLGGCLNSYHLNFENQAKAVRCLYFIAKSDDNDLLLEEKKALIIAVCNALRTCNWQGTSDDNDPSFDLVSLGIELFTSTQILDNTGLHVNVCDAYMVIVEKTERYIRTFTTNCLQFLYTHRNLMRRPFCRYSEDDVSALARTCFSLLSIHSTSLRPPEYMATLQFVEFLLNLGDLVFSEEHDGHSIEKYMELIFVPTLHFQNHRMIVEISFKCLAKLYEQLDDEERKLNVLKDTSLNIIAVMIRSMSKPNTSNAIRFLLAMYNNDTDNYYTRERLDDLTRAIVNLIFVGELQGVPTVKDIFNSIKLLSSNAEDGEDIHDWAAWIVERITE